MEITSLFVITGIAQILDNNIFTGLVLIIAGGFHAGQFFNINVII